MPKKMFLQGLGLIPVFAVTLVQSTLRKMAKSVLKVLYLFICYYLLISLIKVAHYITSIK